jgi:hypothetical protein
MKASKYTLTALGAVGLALAGSVSAFAAFSVEAPGAVMRFQTITMPAFDSAPDVEQNAAKVKLAWVAQKIGGGEKVERYLVTRYNLITGGGAQVCGENVTAARCTDVNVPAGRWKYTLRTVQGTWMGPESKRSDVVKIDAADAATTDQMVADAVPSEAALNSTTSATTTSSPTSPSSSAATKDSKPPAATETSEPTTDPEPAAEPDETTAVPDPPAVDPSPSESSKAAADDKPADK